MKHLENNEVMDSARSAYVKPTMEVYEMEVEGIIMNTSGSPNNYDYDQDGWSKADIDLNDKVFNA